MESVGIIDSIDKTVLEKGLQNVSDRYFQHKYCCELPGIKNVNIRVSFHSNRVCMLSLAENHPIIKNQEAITKVNFEIDEKIDRMKNAASGKGKKGAQKLTPDSIICYIETSSGNYPVYSCIKGKLIEINESLLENPQLLVEKPINEGYIALLLPILNIYGETKDSMLNRDDYLKVGNV